VGLLGAADKSAFATLLSLIQEAPPELAHQAEDTLHALAGQTGPTIVLGSADVAETRCMCCGAWATWWKNNGAKVDWKSYLERERVLGRTIAVEYNTGRVWECGRDKALRWEVKDLAGPIEAQRLPGDYVLIAESGNHTVSVRDLRGNIR
jgi:hypothetical protein